MLIVTDVEKSYKKGGLFRSKQQKIVRKVSFACSRGECLGIIGESGSGKSTLGRLLAGIEKPDGGSILFNGNSVQSRKVRAGRLSVVFQDYTSSINPFFTVEEAILEPLSLKGRHKKANLDKLDHLLVQVGLHPSYRSKYAHELSGGEVQRVCVARAISTQPECIVFDEAISSLDASVQTQVLDLLKQLKAAYKLSYIFITHDIQAAAYICDRVLIFRDGQVEETVDIAKLKDVRSPYAQKLLRSLITL